MNFSTISNTDNTTMLVQKLNTWANQLNGGTHSFKSESVDLSTTGFISLPVVSETGQRVLPLGPWYLIVTASEPWAENPIISIGSDSGNFEDLIAPIEISFSAGGVHILALTDPIKLLPTDGQGLGLVVSQPAATQEASAVLIGQFIWID